MATRYLSNGFSLQERETTLETLRDEFCILPPEEMAKRETLGKRLKTARLKAGIKSVPQLTEKIMRDHGVKVGDSTVRDAEKDRKIIAPGPGFKTLEYIALGVGLDPLEVISWGLDDPPEVEAGFKASQFAQLWKSYAKLDKEQRAFIDDYIETLIEKIERWR